jgi:hypothetical protein
MHQILSTYQTPNQIFPRNPKANYIYVILGSVKLWQIHQRPVVPKLSCSKFVDIKLPLKVSMALSQSTL